MAGIVKKLDAKGRLVLGPEYANTTVLIEKRVDGSLVVRPAAVVPVSEAWLYKNKEALSLVEEGLTEAKSGKLVKDRLPKVSWLDKLED